MTRSARLKGDILTIRIDDKVWHYRVAKLTPDPKVAFPAFQLTKLLIVTAAKDMSAKALEAGATSEWIETKEVRHLAVDEWGARCDCEDCTYRQHACKHILALRALKLIPITDFPP